MTHLPGLLIALISIGLCLHVQLSVRHFERTLSQLRRLPPATFAHRYCRSASKACQVKVRRHGAVVDLCAENRDLPSSARYWRIRCGRLLVGQIYR